MRISACMPDEPQHILCVCFTHLINTSCSMAFRHPPCAFWHLSVLRWGDLGPEKRSRSLCSPHIHMWDSQLQGSLTWPYLQVISGVDSCTQDDANTTHQRASLEPICHWRSPCQFVDMVVISGGCTAVGNPERHRRKSVLLRRHLYIKVCPPYCECGKYFFQKTSCLPGQYPRGYPWKVLVGCPVSYRVYTEHIRRDPD